MYLLSIGLLIMYSHLNRLTNVLCVVVSYVLVFFRETNFGEVKRAFERLTCFAFREYYLKYTGLYPKI